MVKLRSVAMAVQGQGVAVPAMMLVHPHGTAAIAAAQEREFLLRSICAASELPLEDVIEKVKKLPHSLPDIFDYYCATGEFPHGD